MAKRKNRTSWNLGKTPYQRTAETNAKVSRATSWWQSLTPEQQEAEKVRRRKAWMGSRIKRGMARVNSLTEREEAFCVHIVQLGLYKRGSRTMAARLAGYNNPKQRAAGVYRRPRVQRRIAQLMQESPQWRKMKMTINDAVKQLEKFALRDPSGDAANDRNSLSALVEYLKVHGAYVDKIQVSGGDAGNVPLADVLKDLPVAMQKMLLEKMRQVRAAKQSEQPSVRLAPSEPDEDEPEEVTGDTAVA